MKKTKTPHVSDTFIILFGQL